MADVSIAVIGLGRTGASVVLALRRNNDDPAAKNRFLISAAETRPGVAADARRLKIADDIARRPFEAVRGRPIVVLALPYAEMQAAYELIGPQVDAGAVVLDMSPLKLPSLEWAATYLKRGAHMVGLTPVINPAHLFDGLDDTAHASADLFDRGTMLLMPGASCAAEAVELAADFATLLGAQPHFADPAEHDALIAATEGLPAVVGVAAFYMLQHRANWNDAQRLTNASFGRLTHHLFDTHPDDLRDFLLGNRENTVLHLDGLIEALGAFRSILAAGDRAALEAALVESAEAYDAWVNRRYSGRWDEAFEPPKAPSVGGMMSGMLGGFLSDRLGGGGRDEEGGT